MNIVDLKYIHNKYIDGKAKGEFVIVEIFCIARLSVEILASLNIGFDSVVISTKALKHICERRKPEMYTNILLNLKRFLEQPDYICKNKDNGVSEIVCAKLDENLYIMIFLDTNLAEQRFEIRTVHPIDKKDIKKFPIIWQSGGSVTSSS